MGSVLIIEDDDDIRTDVVDILRDEGYDVVSATNGREALGLLQSIAPPCLILLDLMMPVMSGWDFRAAQLENPTLSSIPTVVVSAAQQHQLERLRPQGVLAKPFSVDDLLAVVDKHCAC